LTTRETAAGLNTRTRLVVDVGAELGGASFSSWRGGGTAIAAAYEALGDQQARWRDGPAMVTAGYVLIAVLVVGAASEYGELLASELPRLVMK
jgi:hypothetical protein